MSCSKVYLKGKNVLLSRLCAGLVPMRNLGNPEFPPMDSELSTISCNQHAPLHNGFHGFT